MHAILIESGGIVPLPRVGGALSHALGSIGNLPRHCQTGLPDEPLRQEGLDTPTRTARRGSGFVRGVLARSCMTTRSRFAD
jgi:hypothetical protein